MAREQGSDGRRRLEHFSVDMGELAEGYQFDGRGRAIAQWRERKEAEEFAKLCNRLRVAKRQREIAAEGPGSTRYERMRATQRRWARGRREHETARVKEWRLRQRIKAAPVITCPICAAQWCPVPTRGTGRLPVYCGRKCANKARHRRAKERAA